MNDYEISKLKKQLLRKNEVIKQFKDDLANAESKLVQVQAERDRYHGQLQIARHTLQNVDQVIDQKVKQMRNKLEHQNQNSLNELKTTKEKLMEEKSLNQKYEQQVRNKDAVIAQLTLKIRQLSTKYKDNSMQINVKQITQHASITHNTFVKLTEKYNKLSADMQNILAQNKILRKLHGVPDNFGFDLEQIKIAQKQQLQDYKAQCRKLQTQIQQLEAQRTQLRYRLRQYHTLYSNKGDRYKDLNPRQLQLLDQYVIILKDGGNQFPQIDKTQKQMQRQIIRLRGQVQILQNRNPGTMPSTKQDGNQINKDSLKKLQEQIKAMLQPLVKDIRKLSQDNINSIITNIQHIPAGGQTLPQINPGQISGLRPPIPLPFANNDWTVIKQGYSYRYACKIPIDLKDYDGQIGFDIVRSKYQLAALQLQNIQSLKMLKQKQQQQKLIKSQLNDLKQKFRKCLQVQDDLFIRFFKERDLNRQKSRQTQTDRRRAIDQRDSLASQNKVLAETLNALTTKTSIDAKFKQFGERLAKSQAGIVKGQRKYQILFEQHKYLKDSYTKMQAKAAHNELHLKKKLLTSKANEKQLTFLTNQILQQTKDSVSFDTHNILLAKMQTLNDKSAHLAFKQMDLRMKISRLEGIERQMNIKDQVIQYLRQDKLDLLLELQIIKSRLRAIDPGYRQAFSVLDRLVGHINQNNVSIMECFKKFDRDRSGNLTKDEFKRALSAFNFSMSNEEFDLLFNQFDLDGSNSVNYAQFMRKLKRGGAISRTPDEQAIYLFFKAIKSSKISIKKAFQIVDKDGSNTISKAEMQTAFRQIGIECDSKTVDAIFRLTDDNGDGSISCPQLQSLYMDIVKQTQIDDSEVKPTLDWKYKFVIKVQEASIKNKMTLQQAFKSLDDDSNSYMTINQLSLFLTKVGVSLQNHHLRNLFDFLDIRRDGRVEFGEFLKLLDDAKKQQKRVQRLLAVQRRAAELKKENQVFVKQAQKDTSSKISQQAVLKIKMMSFETKQASLVQKNKKLCNSLAFKQQQIKDKQKTIQQNQKQIQKLRDMSTKQKQDNIRLQQKMKNFIGQFESKKLKQEHQKIKIQNKQLETQLQTFKGLALSLTDKNKMDLMSVQKIKAELNKHYDIVKELQSQNIDKSQLGRLALELQYSKRNQEIVNKKYEDICDENKTLASSNNDLANQSLEKEKQIVNVHLFMIQKTNLMQKNIDNLTSKIMPTVTMSKIDDLISKLRQISSSKSQLQEQNKTLRQKNFNLQLKYDHIQIEKANLNELQNKLRRNHSDQNSIALINITKQLSDYKVSQLRVKREYNLLKEKQQYYMRINNANTDNIKQLQEQLGKWEIKFNERQEFWRKRMADQMKLVDQVQKEVQKTKQMQVKTQKYFNDKQIADQNIDNKYNNLSQERGRQLSMIAKPPSVYRALSSNAEKIDQLQNQVNELTQVVQQKQNQIFKLKHALQELVPEQKLRFSSIGSQIGSYVNTNSLIMQTDLTSSQLKSNARRFLNNQKEQETFLKQEAQKMAQAAQHSIDTLQRIIDDKNQQIKRKDKMIDQLKRQMLRNKNQDCEQIQKLNEEIRQLRSKTQLGNLNHIMNKSTHRQFYPASNEDRTKNLMDAIEQKDIEIKNWERKYNQLYINKIKVKPADNTANNKILQGKLRQINEERELQRQKYIQSEGKLKQKVINLQKLIKQKDGKLANLNNALKQIKQQVVNEKKQLNESQIRSNQQIVANMLRGTSKNDSGMQVMLQRSLQKQQQLTKKLKDAQNEIKKMKQQSQMSKTIGRR